MLNIFKHIFKEKNIETKSKIKRVKIYSKKSYYNWNDILILNPITCTKDDYKDFVELQSIIENPYYFYNLDDEEKDKAYEKKYDLSNKLQDKVLVEEDAYMIDNIAYKEISNFHQFRVEAKDELHLFRLIEKLGTDKSTEIDKLKSTLEYFNDFTPSQKEKFIEKMYELRPDICLLKKANPEIAKDVETKEVYVKQIYENN